MRNKEVFKENVNKTNTCAQKTTFIISGIHNEKNLILKGHTLKSGWTDGNNEEPT